jgi:hypothetical protein
MHYIIIIISSTKTIELKRLIDTPAASEMAFGANFRNCNSKFYIFKIFNHIYSMTIDDMFTF